MLKKSGFPEGPSSHLPLSLSFSRSFILRSESSLKRKDGARKECTTESDAPFSRCKLFALFPAQPEVREMARRESGSGRSPQRERPIPHTAYPSRSFLASVPSVWANTLSAFPYQWWQLRNWGTSRKGNDAAFRLTIPLKFLTNI